MKSEGKILDPGTILKVPLRDGTHGYACILDAPLVGFFDIKTREELDYKVFFNKNFVFKIFVSNSAPKIGKWSSIGKINVPSGLKVKEKFFKQDPVNKKFYIYIDDGRDGFEQISNREEIVGLEAAAVWSAEHIEERLFSKLSGQESQWERLINRIVN